jgi:hypothetical protein
MPTNWGTIFNYVTAWKKYGILTWEDQIKIQDVFMNSIPTLTHSNMCYFTKA